MKFPFFKSVLMMGVLMLFAWIPSVYENPSNEIQKPIRHTVEILHMKFIPEHINVKKGDTVVWINKDFFPHDVTDETKNAWSSGPMDQHKTFSKVITKDENYFCSIHKVMKGTIKIQ